MVQCSIVVDCLLFLHLERFTVLNAKILRSHIFVAICWAFPWVGCAAQSSHHTSDKPATELRNQDRDVRPRIQRAIDMHFHVFFEGELEGGFKNLEHMQKSIGAIVSDPRIKKVGMIVIAPEDLETTKKQNDFILESSKENDKFFPIASVHPAQGKEALLEIERVVKAGAKMLKLHQNTQKFDLENPMVSKIITESTDRGIPILFEGTTFVDKNTVKKLFELAIKHPKARLVLAHMGGIAFREMLVFALFKKYPWWPNNVYFDISYTAAAFANSPMRDELVYVIREVGVDRVMFGSDYPLHQPGEALDALESMGFTEEELDAIAYGTAKTLLDL